MSNGPPPRPQKKSSFNVLGTGVPKSRAWLLCDIKLSIDSSDIIIISFERLTHVQVPHCHASLGFLQGSLRESHITKSYGGPPAPHTEIMGVPK